jgi:hypothetical protein
MADRAFVLVPAQALVGAFLKTFEDFPPRQRPASFSIDKALERAREQQKTIAAAAGEHPEEAAEHVGGQPSSP